MGISMKGVSKALKGSAKGAVAGGIIGPYASIPASITGLNPKNNAITKTITDPLGVGIGDAFYGKNKKSQEQLEAEAAERAAQQAAFEDAQKATDEFVNAGPAKYETGEKFNFEALSPAEKLKFESLSPGEKLQWQALGSPEQQKQSGMADIATDPRYKDAELAALRELEDQSQNGFTARDRADMARVEASVNRANRGRQGAIQQNMQARGMTGSGMDLVAQMQSAQDADEIAAMRALEREGMMQERKSQATMGLGSMSSNLQSRDFGQAAAKAQAQDAIDRFNVANSNEAARYNNQGVNQTAQNNWQQANELARYNNQGLNQTAQANWQQTNADNRYNNVGLNEAANQNWQRANSTSDKNAGAAYDFSRDRMAAKTGQAARAYDYSVEGQKRRELADQQAEQAASGKFGAVLGTVGAVIGGIKGGPAGAQAGYGVGNGIGQGVGRTAYANGAYGRQGMAYGGYVERDPYAPYLEDDEEPIDDPRFDTIPKFLSPGEMVIPRSKAQDPDEARDFVAREKAYRDEKLKSQKAIEDAQKMQNGLGYANVAGQFLTDYNNSQKKDLILGNRFSELGRDPRVVEAKRDQWDRSILDKAGQGVMQGAQAADARVDQNFQRDGAIEEMRRKDKFADANSDVSKQANMLYKATLKARAAEAQQAGDPEGAKMLLGMAKGGDLSAEEAYANYKLASGPDYKDILNNLNANKRLDAQLASQNKQTDKGDRDVTFKLSEKYNQDPTTKATAEVRTSLEKAEALVKKPTPLNDMALVYNFMKANDPGSTVREGEFAMAANSGSLGSQIQQYVAMAGTGQMTPAKRQELLSTIRQQAQAQEARQMQVDGYFGDLASQYGANPELVIGKKRSTSTRVGGPGTPSVAPGTQSAKDLP